MMATGSGAMESSTTAGQRKAAKDEEQIKWKETLRIKQKIKQGKPQQ